MSKLRIVDSRTLEKVLFNLGFESVRQKGSHIFYRHSDGRTTTIPHHRGRVLEAAIKENDIGDFFSLVLTRGCTLHSFANVRIRRY